jgi:sugar/nucleoside kinase (ribokinase family)
VSDGCVSLPVDLVVAGKLAIDEIAIVGKPHPPVLGGTAAHVALAAATAGCRVAVVAAIGKDFPQAFLEQLRTKGIDLTGAVQRSGPSARFVGDYAADGSVRSYGFRFGVANQLSLRAYVKLIAGCRAVHLGILPPHLLRRLIAYVRRGDRLISLTTIFHQVRQFRDRLLPQLPALDILFVNAEEAAMLSGEKDPVQASERLGEAVPLVVITEGAEGCLVNDGGTMFHVPSIPIKHVNTTGAGDSFVGAFLARYLESCDARLAAQWGNAAGALKVTGVGPAPIIAATRDDLQRLVERIRQTSSSRSESKT